MNDDRRSHLECLDGVCGHCEGELFVGCECFECGDSHERLCDHCDGSGRCEVDGNVVATELAKARAEWHALVESTHHPLTKEGFRDAYTQMFQRLAPQDAAEQWWASVEALADDAMIDLRTGKPL